ncbi:hypothetical protein GLW08_17765 [Pontibacillus yanchengensis]|uniref:Uncharacterized protein n=2 Tax=Pontibacillus yanchengensis TaxID=462910 RepID=A0A6I4ZY86_9BACI|nr:hypothetical protein [Pontibacillus yanchengensis]MYL32792.1 hypothetical protein [Pontibacillus yanchengensis]MYL55186.1 hypothetical protein [Pontibacillus yanchengensis]
MVRRILIALISLLQLTGLVTIFFHIWWGLTFIVSSYACLTIVMILLIKERIKEKKEDEENDYRDY